MDEVADEEGAADPINVAMPTHTTVHTPPLVMATNKTEQREKQDKIIIVDGAVSHSCCLQHSWRSGVIVMTPRN